MCDQIIIINDGTIIAKDSPQNISQNNELKHYLNDLDKINDENLSNKHFQTESVANDRFSKFQNVSHNENPENNFDLTNIDSCELKNDLSIPKKVIIYSIFSP